MRIFALLALVLLTGCGRFGDTYQRLRPGSATEVTFASPRVQNERGEVLSMATLAGGIMVYAVDADEPFRRGGKRLTDEFAQVSWTIPTARYIFYGIGYQATGMSNASPMHCGQTPPIQLDGTPKTIQLVLDQNNCGNPPFSAPGWNTGNQPSPINIAACSNNSSVTIGSTCGTNSSWGTAHVIVSMPEYVAFNGELFVSDAVANDITSACTDFGTPGMPTALNIVLPTGAGPPGDPFVYGFDTNDSACGTNPTNRRLYGLGRSLSNAGNMALSVFEVNGVPFGPSLNPIVVGASAGELFIYLRDLN